MHLDLNSPVCAAEQLAACNIKCIRRSSINLCFIPLRTMQLLKGHGHKRFAKLLPGNVKFLDREVESIFVAISSGKTVISHF